MFGLLPCLKPGSSPASPTGCRSCSAPCPGPSVLSCHYTCLFPCPCLCISLHTFTPYSSPSTSSTSPAHCCCTRAAGVSNASLTNAGSYEGCTCIFYCYHSETHPHSTAAPGPHSNSTPASNSNPCPYTGPASWPCPTNAAHSTPSPPPGPSTSPNPPHVKVQFQPRAQILPQLRNRPKSTFNPSLKFNLRCSFSPKPRHLSCSKITFSLVTFRTLHLFGGDSLWGLIN